MRIIVYLPNQVRTFQPTDAQVAALTRALAGHVIEEVSDELALLSALPRADAVVVWKFEASWYERAPRLQHVFTPSAGRERIAADPSARVTAHFGTFHGQLMSESLAAMVLHMNRRFGDAERAQREQAWDRSRYETTRLLRGQVALIVGYGAIGRRAANLLRALGMRVHAVKRDPTRGSEGAERVFAVAQLDEALANADHVACILPDEASTRGLFDRRALSRMKPSAYLYNLGRGSAIEESALLEALTTGRIAGAFLDVTELEPLPKDSPLWTAPNLVLTPHASAIYLEYLDLYFEELAHTLARLAQMATL